MSLEPTQLGTFSWEFMTPLMELYIPSNLCSCSREPKEEPTCRTGTRALFFSEQSFCSYSDMEVISWLQSSALGTAAVKNMSPAVKSVANVADCLSVYPIWKVQLQTD